MSTGAKIARGLSVIGIFVIVAALYAIGVNLGLCCIAFSIGLLACFGIGG